MEQKFFERALELAKKGQGFTSPNPCVGAVIVKNGKILGEGYHKKAGGKHAEIVAFESARKRGFSVQGSDIYVTLEPCCHIGKTPPCTDALIQFGVKRVFIGMKDPFHLVHGKGLQVLKKSGIDTFVLSQKNPLFKQIVLINQPFLKSVKTGLPYVTLKCAVSLDGKVATSVGDSQWITGEKTRTDSRIERSKCDAVLVGAGTIKADNPQLGVHKSFFKKFITRVIIDPNLSISIKSNVFRDQHVVVVTTELANKKNIEIFRKQGIHVEIFGKNRVNIKNLLKFLYNQGIHHVFVEGGGKIHGSFFDAAGAEKNVVDRVIWYVAPKIIGGIESIDSVAGKGVQIIAKSHVLQMPQMEIIGNDIKVSGYLNLY